MDRDARMRLTPVAVALAMGAMAGSAGRLLVELRTARRVAGAARRRADMFEQVCEAVGGLLDVPEPRQEVCAAARRIAGGHASIIYEPAAGGRELVCTASAGVSPGADGRPIGVTSAIWEAFQDGRPVFLDLADPRSVVSPDLWRAAGRPISVLYQPMLHSGRTFGVLAVGWRDAVAEDGPQRAVVALLAQEAAAAIAHSDAIGVLAGEARSDPLTGLPNRRSWESELARAIAADGALSVAVLDLDRFKEFNDGHGHPAGDRLLRGCAAAWRSQLRAGDLLARIGGEEFAVALRGCDGALAVEILDRLRAVVPDEQTCSVGLAMRQPGESAESLVGRADRALYEAKHDGRDCLRLAR